MAKGSYVVYRNTISPFRIPKDGWFDLTYRCNNNCVHCWIRIPAGDKIREEELSLNEIQIIADHARQAGCNKWFISGGEPMLRPDFSDIFDYLTRDNNSYHLNTNGTLITPGIAKLLTRRGTKLVAIYGATEDVHDTITRNPGSFEACMRGFSYLKEAKAGFSVQIIPMRDNFHQLDEMVDLAKSLSPNYRFGASWLYLTADRNIEKNKEIISQRLSPEEIVAFDPGRPVFEDYVRGTDRESENSHFSSADDRLKQECIKKGKQFHIDPYGKMSFCLLMKDPSLRFSLRKNSFLKIWDELIPSCHIQNHQEKEYQDFCGSCEKKNNCTWCPAYAYLETGRLSAPIQSLCQISKERIKFKEKWMKNNYQMFEIAGMTVHVDADIPLTTKTFGERFDSFRTDKAGDDNLYISHHFSLPDLGMIEDAQLVYNVNPWAIYRMHRSWIYLGLGSQTDHMKASSVAVFNDDHTHVRIYHEDEHLVKNGNMGALTGFPSDQIMLSRVLSDRSGCYLHSSALILNGQGIMFLGQSGAGKSTIVKILKDYGHVLTDDRNIVRSWPDGHRVHGTWSHGEVPIVSNKSAPLKAIFFIEQAQINQIFPVLDQRHILHELINRIIKPFCTVGWWNNSLKILENISTQVPVYCLRFSKGPDVIKSIEKVSGPLKPQDR
jgi:MoaA/NifB/PqqE/SkfB family radical SAM enzyme